MRTAARELIDAKSASGDDLYARATLEEDSSLGKAFRNKGGHKAELQNLRTMCEIADKYGYTPVIEAETPRVAQAFRILARDAGVTGRIIVRVHR